MPWLPPRSLPVPRAGVSRPVLQVVDAVERVEEVFSVEVADPLLDQQPDQPVPVRPGDEACHPLVDRRLLRRSEHAAVKVHQLPVPPDVVGLVNDPLELGRLVEVGVTVIEDVLEDHVLLKAQEREQLGHRLETDARHSWHVVPWVAAQRLGQRKVLGLHPEVLHHRLLHDERLLMEAVEPGPVVEQLVEVLVGRHDDLVDVSHRAAA